MDVLLVIDMQEGLLLGAEKHDSAHPVTIVREAEIQGSGMA